MTYQKSINWEEIEPRIRPMVKLLNDKGFVTTASCGHEMWVLVSVDGPYDTDALRIALRDYKDLQITYYIRDYADKPTEQYAKVTFLGEHLGDGHPIKLVLLKVDPTDHPIYFVVEHRVYPSIDAPGFNFQYFYEEHTCPTNWTKNIVGIIAQGDEDPHGFVEFVSTAEPPKGYICGVGVDSWKEIFPEVENKTSDTPWTDSIRKALDKEKKPE